MSIFTDFQKDLAKRSIINLDYIQKQVVAGEINIFEVTQLINSLLGVIICIKETESFDDILKGTLISDIDKEKWGIPEIPPRYFKDKSIYGIVYNLRNAAAHLNITLRPEKGDNIESIKFQSKDQDTKEILWSCVFSIKQLDNFLRELTAFILRN